MQVSRALGDVGWWVFIVGLLLGEPSAGAPLPRRYADPAPGGFYIANAVTAAAWLALVTVVIAAVVNAVLLRRWWFGVATAAAPILGAAIVLFALHERAGSVGGSLQLGPLPAALLVLVGIAVREVWSRAVVPSVDTHG
ncbi:hypothetical protein [Mycobacterium talmoniae]|uniref:Uncharacterized protein n=1 Tax=Mycobacterium talmoniae TaxID=1858794 RepID=A0A1S1N5J8_9MYCO|nr:MULTISPECIES: hypothetical protein [Mycobacterium]OHU94627.1 hypothetical protein BKN37_23545 [Mycobacterium talmoniae]PQM45589.1 hypothetical protein C1Y40_04236 [Mycobacterium talmoniae]TDH48758.1 hypothetical protein E2F47_22585 [Mycobacterium eburneum]